MAARSRRGAASSAEVHRENGRGEGPSRKTIETIKDATGASEEDIMVMLQECNNDVNETTSRLIDNPFSQVLGKKDKKKKREEERKKDGSKVIEVRRQPNTGQGGERRNRDRGSRTSIDKNGHDRSAGKGRSQQAKHEEDPVPTGAPERDSLATDEPKSAPVAEPSPQRTSYSRAPGPPGSSVPPPAAAPVWGGKKNWADMLKQPQAPATTLPPSGSLQAPIPDSSQNDVVPPDPQLAELSIADPTVSAPRRISSSTAADTSLSASQDVQVQGPSPRHPQLSSSLGIGPVVQPPRYASTDNAAPAPPPNAWGKPKAAASPIVGPPSGQSPGTSLLSSALGGSASMGFSAAPAPIAPPAASASNNISVADPQVTSSGLLGSGMGTSFTHHNDLKAPEPVVLSHQVHDSSNQGLQFGQSGGLNFGNFGSETAGSIDALKPPQTSQLEHQTSSQHVGSAPSNQGLDVFTGMSAFQDSLDFSVQSLQQPAASKATVAAPAAPARQQDTSSSQQFYGASGYQAPASQPSYSAHQAAPSSQAAASYDLYSAQGTASQAPYGAFAPQSTYQAPAQQQQAQGYGQYGQHAAAAQQPQNSHYAMPAASAEPAAAPSGPEPSQVTSYDNSSYASYGQASSFKDYQQQQAPQQPAAPVQPKYSAPNVALPPPPQQQQQASAAAGPHAAYNSGYGHSATAYGSTASPAPSTSAPPSGASNQGTFGAPQAAAQQQQVPYGANLGYAHPSQYNNYAPYAMNSGYGGSFQQPAANYSGYGGAYGGSHGGQGATSGFAGGYGQGQSSKYQGNSGYSQGGLYSAPQRGGRGGYPANGYDDPSTTGGYGHASKDREAAYSQQAPSLYGSHAHAAGAPPYQGGRDGGYGYGQSGQGYGGYGAANQGYGGYGNQYGGYGQSGQNYSQNGPSQMGGFGKLG